MRAIPREGLGEGPPPFITFSAPGRELGGRTHSRRTGSGGKALRCGCGRVHSDSDHPLIGTPLDPDTFDYAGLVAWYVPAQTLSPAQTDHRMAASATEVRMCARQNVAARHGQGPGQRSWGWIP